MCDTLMKSHHHCVVCGKSFKGTNGLRDLKTHTRSHGPKASREKPKKSHICLKCGISYPFKSYLDRHMNRTHSSSMIEVGNSHPVLVQSGLDLVIKNYIKKEAKKDAIVVFPPISMESKEDPLNVKDDFNKQKRKQNLDQRHSF